MGQLDSRPTGIVNGDPEWVVTVCHRHEHDWAEGDEGAIYCCTCTGYQCSTCGATGQVPRGCGTKRCYACGGFGVEMAWPEVPYRINPWNWAEASKADA